jgi:hypothetical protein
VTSVVSLHACRKVPDYSRRTGLPVAFGRMIGESVVFNRATPFVRWIEGFEPDRNEMVFEPASRSCYCCKPFAALVNHSRGGIALARFAGGAACLSTLIDGFHQNHKVTFLCDASAATRARRCRPTRCATQFPQYREYTPRCIKRRSGSPRLRLAS